MQIACPFCVRCMQIGLIELIWMSYMVDGCVMGNELFKCSFMLFFWVFSQNVFQWKLPFIYLKSPPRAFHYQRAKMEFLREKHLHRNCSIIPSVLVLFLNPLQISSRPVSLSQLPTLADCTSSNIWITSSSAVSPVWGKSAVTKPVRQKNLSFTLISIWRHSVEVHHCGSSLCEKGIRLLGAKINYF